MASIFLTPQQQYNAMVALGGCKLCASTLRMVLARNCRIHNLPVMVKGPQQKRHKKRW